MSFFFAFCRKELNRSQQEIPKLPGKRNRLDTKLHQMRIDEFVSSLLLLAFVKRVHHYQCEYLRRVL